MAQGQPGETGSYSFDVEPGWYRVTLNTEGYAPSYVGDILVKADSERKRKLTAVCSHQTRIGNLDAHLI
ncbi:hypothetical protein BGK51_24500 [Shigella sp. FC569]|nr:hypothetical protein BGK51_24500 [Shigella sp. FC569]